MSFGEIVIPRLAGDEDEDHGNYCPAAGAEWMRSRIRLLVVGEIAMMAWKRHVSPCCWFVAFVWRGRCPFTALTTELREPTD